jgi:hypothetical protein
MGVWRLWVFEGGGRMMTGGFRCILFGLVGRPFVLV